MSIHATRGRKVRRAEVERPAAPDLDSFIRITADAPEQQRFIVALRRALLSGCTVTIQAAGDAEPETFNLAPGRRLA